jgi:mRNA interferase MazF
MVSYRLRQGDIVYISLDPQSGRRPALVVSNNDFNEKTNMALFCPIANTERAFPLHVAISGQSRTTGFVLCEQLKALDYERRNAQFVEQISVETLDEVLHILRLCF